MGGFLFVLFKSLESRPDGYEPPPGFTAAIVAAVTLACLLLLPLSPFFFLCFTFSGGGGAGGWRLVNMWLRRNAGKPLPEAFGGGWEKEDARTLKKAIVNLAPTGMYSTKPKSSKKRQPNVDVLVFRISQPWMHWKEIDPTSLHKTVAVAREQLGVKMVVLMTIPFSNNIVDDTDIRQMHAKNDMIHQFARDYPTDPERLDDMTVVTWDLAQLNNALVHANAREMGYRTKDSRDFDFSLNTLYNPKTMLKPNSAVTHTRSIGHVCGGPLVPHNATDCIYNNMITVDGQHLCLKTFGGRMMAGLACVIRCATTYAKPQDGSLLLRECEEACNGQYMSLNELDESLWAGNQLTKE